MSMIMVIVSPLKPQVGLSGHSKHGAFIPFANRKKNRLWECTWFTKLGFGIRLEPHFQFFHSGALKAGHRGTVQFHTAEMGSSQLCGLATCVLYFWLHLSSSHDRIRSFTPPDPRGTALGFDMMLTVPWIQPRGRGGGGGKGVLGQCPPQHTHLIRRVSDQFFHDSSLCQLWGGCLQLAGHFGSSSQ